MITVENVIEWAKPHPLDGGKMTRIYNDDIEASIVGGRSGLYGDFEKDFEVAIIDKKDDMTGENLVELLNKMFSKGFQVR